MNKIIYGSVLATLMLFGCTKENVIEPSSLHPKLVVLSDGGKNSITMLEFSSYDHFFNTVKTLDGNVSKHNDDFLAKYTNLDDDALNAKAEELGFEDYQPLIDFERSYGINSSMRQIYTTLEEEWLNNEELDPKTDPAIKYCFGRTEMSLLNSNGEVKIGDKLLKLTEKGYIEIRNVDIVTLIRINNGDWTALNEPTVNTEIEIDGADNKGCDRWKGRDLWDPYATNKKVKMHVHFHSWPARGTAKAELDSYHKPNNRWKKYKRSLGVAVQSYMKNSDCGAGPSAWSGWERKNKKGVGIGNTSWGVLPQYRAENGQSVIGYFEYAGISKNLILTW